MRCLNESEDTTEPDAKQDQTHPAKTDATKSEGRDQTRTSRRLLAAAQSIPEYLTTMFEIPDGVTVAHTCHADNTLPLFQIRLSAGTYEGKHLGIFGMPCR